jgi:hypothetical protein
MFYLSVVKVYQNIATVDLDVDGVKRLLHKTTIRDVLKPMKPLTRLLV